MKKVLLFIIPMVLLSCTTTEDLSYTIENPQLLDNEIVDFHLYIPDLLEQKIYFPQFCIDIEIQGEIYPFMVDTGDRSGSLKFSQKTMDKLINKSTGKTGKSLTIYGSNTNTGYLISNVKVGDLILNDVEVNVTNDSWFEPFNKYNEDIGIIGWNFLREFNILFDFKSNSLKLYKKGYIPNEVKAFNGVEYIEEEKLLYISGYLGDDTKKYDFLLDSGAGNLSQTINGEFIHLDSIFDSSFNRAKNSSIAVTENLKKPYILNSLYIEDLEIPGLKFGLLKNIPWFLKYKFEGFLGSGFFTTNKLFFDTENNMLYIIK